MGGGNIRTPGLTDIETYRHTDIATYRLNQPSENAIKGVITIITLPSYSAQYAIYAQNLKMLSLNFLVF